ncbi:MAG: MarR family transcriptional regulator [Bacillota bacterium]|nr:MarR family transcriptional regulator [Bacillota bacterium]
MNEHIELLDFFMENMKKIFYPEEWIALDLKFSKSELFTLVLIDKKREITMSELAEYINAPMSTTTGVVDRLVKNKFLKRERSEEDRRIVVIRLTDKGKELVNELKEVMLKYINIIFENLTEEEKQLLMKILLKITDILSKNNKDKLEVSSEVNKLKKIQID